MVSITLGGLVIFTSLKLRGLRTSLYFYYFGKLIWRRCSSWIVCFFSVYPTDIYLFKVNNKTARTTSLSLLLTLNRFHSCPYVSIVDFEQVNADSICVNVSGDVICPILKLLKLHHSFLLLSNAPKVNLHYVSVVLQMPNRVLIVRRPLVSITLVRSVMSIYLKLWRLWRAFFQDWKIQFFGTWKSSLLRTGSGKGCASCNFVFPMTCAWICLMICLGVHPL